MFETDEYDLVTGDWFIYYYKTSITICELIRYDSVVVHHIIQNPEELFTKGHRYGTNGIKEIKKLKLNCSSVDEVFKKNPEYFL